MIDSLRSTLHLQSYQWCPEFTSTSCRPSASFESLLPIACALSSCDRFGSGYWWVQRWMGWLSIRGRQESKIGQGRMCLWRILSIPIKRGWQKGDLYRLPSLIALSMYHPSPPLLKLALFYLLLLFHIYTYKRISLCFENTLYGSHHIMVHYTDQANIYYIWKRIQIYQLQVYVIKRSAWNTYRGGIISYVILWSSALQLCVLKTSVCSRLYLFLAFGPAPIP